MLQLSKLKVRLFAFFYDFLIVDCQSIFVDYIIRKMIFFRRGRKQNFDGRIQSVFKDTIPTNHFKTILIDLSGICFN